MRIAVLGAGISGLTAAHVLRQQLHAEVVVFEARDRVGGNIRSEAISGCIFEWGPNGFQDNEPATLALVAELGLTSRLVQAQAQAALRFVWRDGRLRQLPTSPPTLLQSDCLTWGGRLRLLLEPFAEKPPEGEESVHDFAVRHLGQQAAEILVDAFVTGIFAGDPRRLSVASAFPQIHGLATRHGSLLRAARRGGTLRATLCSLDGGLEVLVETLARGLDVRLNARLPGLPAGFDHVLCTVPAPRAAELVGGELGALLRQIPMAPIVVVGLVLATAPPVPEAFGFLVPRGQGLRILGTLYESAIFPGRTVAGRRLFRVLLGGRRDPDVIGLSDDEILSIVAHDLRRAWGQFPEPETIRVVRHATGIAQYELGHQQLLAQIARACPPHLHLLGSSYRGIALNACVKEATHWRPPA